MLMFLLGLVLVLDVQNALLMEILVLEGRFMLLIHAGERLLFKIVMITVRAQQMDVLAEHVLILLYQIVA